MNEELEALLRDAHAQGFTTEQMDQIVAVYMGSKNPQAQPQEQPQESKSPYAFGYQPPEQPKKAPVLYPNVEPDRDLVDELGQSFQDYVTSPYKAFASGIVNRIPEAYNTLKLEDAASDTFYGKTLMSNPDYVKDRNFPKTEEERKELESFVLAKHKASVGEVRFNAEKDEFEQKRLANITKYSSEVKKQQREAAEMTGGNIESFRDIKNPLDAVNFIASGAGDAAATGLATGFTGGMGILALEYADAYNQSVDEIAKRMSEDTGVEFTADKVRELGLDRAARDQAKTTAVINAGLESAGLLLGPLGKIGGRIIGKAASKSSLWKTLLKAGTGEGLTEFLQESNTIFESYLAADYTPEEAFAKMSSENRWEDAINAGLKGISGGVALTAVSSAGQTKTEQAQEKAIDAKAEKQVKLDKANAIIAKDVAETEVAVEVDDLTEDSIVTSEQEIIEQLKQVQELEEQEKISKAKEKDAKPLEAIAKKAVEDGAKLVTEEKTEVESKQKEVKTKASKKTDETIQKPRKRTRKPSTEVKQKNEPNQDQVAVQETKETGKVSKTTEPKPVIANKTEVIEQPNLLTPEVTNAEETNLGGQVAETREEAIEVQPTTTEETNTAEALVSDSDTGVTAELTPKQQTKVRNEGVKFLNMFNNRNKLPKKSMRLTRLAELVERIENSSVAPEQHDKLIKRIEKITGPLQKEAEVLAEKKKAKANEVVVEPTKAEVAKKDAEVVKAERAQSLEKRKNDITKKYAKVTDSRGNLVVPAVPQVDKDGKQLWDQTDLDEIRKINEEVRAIQTFTPEELEAYDAANAKVKDSSLAKAIAKGDIHDTNQGTPIDGELASEKTRAEIAGSIESVKQVSGVDYVERLVSKTPESLQGPVRVIATKILEVVEKIQRSNGKTIKFYEMVGSETSTVDGRAIRDDGNIFVLVDSSPNAHFRAGFHELVHALDFVSDKKSRAKIEALRSSFADLVSFKAKRYYEAATGIGTESLSPQDLAFFEYIYQSIPNSEKTGRTEIAKILSDKKSKYRAGTKESIVRGFADSYEFVAEAFSNAFLAAALATNTPSVSGNISTKTTFFKQIAESTIELLNTIIDYVNNSLGTDITKLQGFDNSYLGNLASVLDQNLDASLDSIESAEDISLDTISELPAQNKTDAQKELEKIKKNLSDKLFRGALKSGVMTEAGLTNYLKEFLKNQTIPKSIVNGLKTRLRNHLKHVKIVKSKDEVVAKSKKTFLYKSVTPFANIINDLAAVVPDFSNAKQTQLLANLILNLQSNQVTKELAQQVNKLSEYTALQDTNSLSDPNNGIKFREFDGGLRKLFMPLVNFNAFIKYISDYREKAGVLLNKYFYRPVETAAATASQKAEVYVSELNRLAEKEKLNDENFTNIYFYGVLSRESSLRPDETLEQKLEFQRGALRNKRKAIETGAEKRYASFSDRKGVSVVDKAEASLERVAKAMTEKKNPLNKGEQEYYDLVREILEELREPLRYNTELVHGDQFIWDTNYIPTRVIDKIATDSNQSTGSNVKEADLLDHLNAQTNPLVSDGTPRYSNVSAPQAGASKQRRASNARSGYYYDDNINTVMSKYLHSTLFDIEAAYKVKKLNHMFSDRGGMRSKLESPDGLGHSNTQHVLAFIRRAITNTIMVRPNYSVGTKVALQVKNLIQTAKVADITAPLTQYMTMLPATLALTGMKATSKALSTQIALTTNSIFGNGVEEAKFEELLSKYGGELAVRNFFFEKYENLDDARSKFGRFDSFKKTSERATVYLMSKSDAASARLTWLAAFFEAGGDLNKPSTWTEDRFIKAGSKTTSLQNTSSAIFTGSAFQRADSGQAALWKAAMLSFKSFAANTMVNFWLAAPQAFTRKEAAQIAAAQATSSLAYGVASPLRGIIYAGAVNAIAKILTGEEPPEEPDNEDYFIKGTIEGMYSLMFGGLPNFVDPYLRLFLSETIIKDAVDSDNYKTGTPEAYLYSAKDMNAASKTLLGIYGPLAYSMFDMSMYAYEGSKAGMGFGDKTTEEVNNDYRTAVVGAAAELVVLNPYIPLRGDIYKATNKYKQRRRTEEFQQGSGTKSARKRVRTKRKRSRGN